jgi:hypothetical protein
MQRWRLRAPATRASALPWLPMKSEVWRNAVRRRRKDTSKLIEQSISKSDEGSLRLDEMAAAMASITGSTEQVRGLVAGVSGASQEQAHRFQGLARSVSEIRRGTESAAASAQQSARGRRGVKRSGDGAPRRCPGAQRPSGRD